MHLSISREEEAIQLDGLNAAQIKEIREKSEKHVFQAEVNRMMKLIINSLYKNKEVSEDKEHLDVHSWWIYGHQRGIMMIMTMNLLQTVKPIHIAIRLAFNFIMFLSSGQCVQKLF